MDKNAARTEALVKAAFRESYGFSPRKVMDFDGIPPNPGNNYLYSVAFGWFLGKVSIKGAPDMVFSVYEENGNWRADFTPVGK